MHEEDLKQVPKFHKFEVLFKAYGYTVEQMSEDSFIADNGVFCIPYTEYDRYGSPEMLAITIDSCHKEELKEMFKDEEQIGCAAYCDRPPFKVYWDYICNHDCMFYEVKNALERMAQVCFEKKIKQALEEIAEEQGEQYIREAEELNSFTDDIFEDGCDQGEEWLRQMLQPKEGEVCSE